MAENSNKGKSVLIVGATGYIGNATVAEAVRQGYDVIAVAAWSHVALYDDASFVLLATPKIRGYPDFEQDVGIAMIGDKSR